MKTNVETMVDAVRRLPLEDRQKLVQALLSERTENAPTLHRITQLRGLGKDIWKGVDAQDYVDTLRNS